jgi:hypothetical protein
MNSYLPDTTNNFNIMGSNRSMLASLLATGLMSNTTIESLHLPKFDLLKPLRNWLDNLKIANPRLALNVRSSAISIYSDARWFIFPRCANSTPCMRKLSCSGSKQCAT